MVTRKMMCASLLALLACPVAALADPVYAISFLPSGFDARAINNAGHIVGNTGAGVSIWDGATLINLGLGAESYGYAINSRGDIAGALNGGYGQPFLYSGGTLRYAGPALDEFQSGRANGLNDLGQIAGEYATFGGDQHAWMDASDAFLYIDGRMTDLNRLVDGADGWTVVEAYDINDAQQILGKACRGEECLSVRLDLVSAVPEPGSYALLAAGLVLLAGRSRSGRGRDLRFG